MKSLTENSAPPKQLKTLKRRVGYTDEEVSTARAKIERMAIDEPADEPREKESEPKESREVGT